MESKLYSPNIFHQLYMFSLFYKITLNNLISLFCFYDFTFMYYDVIFLCMKTMEARIAVREKGFVLNV